MSLAIDHRTWNTGLPVRSAVLKPCAGRLVVGWVTTSEYLLLIVFGIFAVAYCCNGFPITNRRLLLCGAPQK
jgi:hypothetical protein